jgi:hypothetical protein
LVPLGDHALLLHRPILPTRARWTLAEVAAPAQIGPDPLRTGRGQESPGQSALRRAR